ncbi:MAG: hypothetical protein ACKOYN_11730 [Planctomycetota bacterium]
MKVLALLAVGAVTASAMAADYGDASNDLFDNGFDNLDITNVAMSDDGVNLSITVTTRGFQNWTKYMLYFDTVAGGTTSNAWSRPVDLAGREIDFYMGSWVDAASNNSQFVSWTGSAWNWGSESYLTNSVSGNSVTWTVALAALGLGANQTFYFDVATSGGGNDPGVDHLSRSDLATPGWGTASTAGSFLSYTTIPAPGAVALLGLAGLVGRRRR